jgi:hypothetical protein
MNEETLAKAYKFVRHGMVRLERDSNPPNFLHFSVNNHEVWRTYNKKLVTWQCNARDGDYGCCMRSKDNTEDQCAHCKAAALFYAEGG